MKLDPFYPIVENATLVGQMAAAGAKLVQIRIKDKPENEVQQEISAALAIAKASAMTLVINDYWKLAIKKGGTFLHLGQSDLDTADIAAIRKAGLLIGISTHDENELARALSLNPNYIALGPIYQTTLKVMPWAPQGLEKITVWRQKIGKIPLVTIGGITLSRAPLCLAAGANSVAVVSDIIQASDPIAHARSWIDATRFYA